MIYIHLTYSGGLGWLLENLREFIFLDLYVYLSNMPHILQMPGRGGVCEEAFSLRTGQNDGAVTWKNIFKSHSSSLPPLQAQEGQNHRVLGLLPRLLNSSLKWECPGTHSGAKQQPHFTEMGPQQSPGNPPAIKEMNLRAQWTLGYCLSTEILLDPEVSCHPSVMWLGTHVFSQAQGRIS